MVSNAALLLGCGMTAVPVALPAQDDVTVVYLVRHAERADDGSSDDPALSMPGRARVGVLNHLLQDAALTAVYSTDYRRTRETAQPVAEHHDLDIHPYDPSQLEEFAARLAEGRGQVLVVGHSNTTTMVVEALGGVPGRDIDEAEYDRLYVVVLDRGKAMSTVQLRYGDPYVPQEHDRR